MFTQGGAEGGGLEVGQMDFLRPDDGAEWIGGLDCADAMAEELVFLVGNRDAKDAAGLKEIEDDRESVSGIREMLEDVPQSDDVELEAVKVDIPELAEEELMAAFPGVIGAGGGKFGAVGGEAGGFCAIEEVTVARADIEEAAGFLVSGEVVDAALPHAAALGVVLLPLGVIAAEIVRAADLSLSGTGVAEEDVAAVALNDVGFEYLPELAGTAHLTTLDSLVFFESLDGLRLGGHGWSGCRFFKVHAAGRRVNAGVAAFAIG